MRQETRPPGLDFEAIRREADAAVKDFLENRWDAYMANVRRLEALPENQSGSDKSWVDRATAAWRRHYKNTRQVR